MAGIQGVIVGKNSARVCIRAAHNVPSRLSFLRFLPVLFGFKLSVRGGDAIIKLTHGYEEAHCECHTV